ncbi:MAG: winged helix-turn-helix transcriptional regulator [Deltaproteobacteria bacterium]|nr:winged helix-turn-helix transcriptional regulator [Deltaproteobacteria bacterium]
MKATTLSFGEAEINFDTHEVTVSGEEVQLTQLELDLLRYFAQNAGRVLSRTELLERVWKLRNYGNTRSRQLHLPPPSPLRTRPELPDPHPLGPRRRLQIHRLGDSVTEL